MALALQADPSGLGLLGGCRRRGGVLARLSGRDRAGQHGLRGVGPRHGLLRLFWCRHGGSTGRFRASVSARDSGERPMTREEEEEARQRILAEMRLRAEARPELCSGCWHPHSRHKTRPRRRIELRRWAGPDDDHLHGVPLPMHGRGVDRPVPHPPHRGRVTIWNPRSGDGYRFLWELLFYWRGSLARSSWSQGFVASHITLRSVVLCVLTVTVTPHAYSQTHVLDRRSAGHHHRTTRPPRC
jgi:hypothetical protein